MPLRREIVRIRDRAVTAVAIRLGRPPYQDRLREVIARLVPGRSFLDVGCMFGVDGGYCFHAVECGGAVSGLDVRVPTEACVEENRRRGNPVTFHVGDVNDPSLPERLGTFDVVFCSGVLYHVPNPMLTLERLRALSKHALVLGTSLIPELEVPQAALFYPFLTDEQRRRLAYRSPTQKVGLDTPYREDWDYSNYFWGMSPSCVRAMLKTAHLELVEEHLWKRAGCFVCTV